MGDGIESTSSHGRSNRSGKSKQKKDKLPYLAKLNSEYQKHDIKKTLEKGFAEKIEINLENGATLYSEPFQCCKMSNIVKDEEFLIGLKNELLDKIFIEKNNDLYKFQQTDDLKKVSTPHVKLLKKLIYGDVRDWLIDVTGIPLNDKVDLTCSRYEHTDVLLCHDDELDSRRIAFILYLVPSWRPEDGGSLDLFNMDEHGQPKEITRCLLPEWNTLSWFEVTEASHHQVSEVFSDDKVRLSINGWFHGPIIPRQERHVEPPAPLFPSLSIEEDVFRKWINPIYLDPVVQNQIQEKFEEESEIELQGFLQDDKYHAVLEALKGTNMLWSKIGPANKRNYLKASDEHLPEIIRECRAFLQSDALFLTLSDLTGLSLHHLAQKNVDVVSGEEESEDSDSSEQAPENSTTDIICDITENVGEKSKPEKKRIKLDTDNSDTEKLLQDDPTVTPGCSGDENKNLRTTAKCRTEVRKWTQGSYTLIHDTDSEGSEYALDAMLFFSCKGWQPEYGGYVTYIAKGEDEELLTVNPAENAFALVYRDKDTLRFVKHINSRINEMQNEPEFYDLSGVYYE